MILNNATLLFEGANSTVYYVEDQTYEKPVIVKILKAEHPSPEQISIYENEINITQSLNIQGVRKSFTTTQYDGKTAVILEYVDGESIKKSYVEAHRSLEDFLKIAIKICQTLSDIHQQNIIHKDINSNNILINLKQGSITIIDFGISTKLNLKTTHLGNPERLEGTLQYISPEQTGRMNRVIDYRTDLYSLGVVFYEVITKRLPFESLDPLELVHAHLAKTAVEPTHLNSQIPPVLSKIIMKLLSKNAEDRYQSALGLKHDLEKVLNQILSKKYTDFELGLEDFSGKFQIPQKLYGRGPELEALMESYTRICQGDTELLLVEGYSGVGKSALVQEIHKPVTEKKGYFVEGKFDQFQRNVPYFAWIQAFQEFINQILTEDAQSLEKWKERILESVGENGQVLINVLPTLELVIGEQPEIDELGPTESQNRFQFVFQNFVNAISKKDFPMVIFIDDWQWADSSSLNMLKILLVNKYQDYMLVIGAYRSNEVSATHPFMEVIEEIKEEQVFIQKITLGNLQLESVEELVSDTLKIEKQHIKDLSDLLYQKTQGNAFFVNQILKNLYEEEYLFFDYESRKWKWDIAKIQGINLTENVVELLSETVKKLSSGTQHILKLAACIGNRFSLDTLNIIDEDNPDEIIAYVKAHLEEPLTEGLIAPINEDFKFVHDRIQQAVYSLIPEDQKALNHLKIGRLFLENSDEDQIEERLFEIVNQWNFGIELLTDPDEKRKLAVMNLRAGKKAKASAAYVPALLYLENAISLLPSDSWEVDYQNTLTIYQEAIQVVFLRGEFGKMEGYIAELFEKAKTVIDKIPGFETKMQFHIAEGDQKAALDLGLHVLSLLQVPLSINPQKNYDLESILKLPPLEDESKLAAMDIMDSIITPAWSLDPLLFQQICYTMVNLSVRHGDCPSSAVGYAYYGGILCGTLGDIENGFKFGKLAVDVVDKFNAKYIESKVVNLYASTVLHWKEPVSSTIAVYNEAAQVGLETGDIEFASYNVVESCHYQWMTGVNLDTLLAKYERSYSQIEQLKQRFHLDYLSPFYQMILNLTTKEEGMIELKGSRFDSTIKLPVFIEENQMTLAFITYQAKALLAYWFKDFDLAYKNIVEADIYKEGVTGMLFLPIHNFYYSLILTSKYAAASEEERGEYLNKIQKNQEDLKMWAYHAPANHQHKYDLVQAELYRINGQILEAMDSYEAAIYGAREQKYMQEEALSYELAAEFYLKQGKSKIAKTYFWEAYESYLAWGAKKKAADLEKRNRTLMDKANMSTKVGATSTVSSTMAGDNLDISTIIKASQTLSGEVQLGSLLGKVMKIVLENAGAEKGILILEKGKSWLIQARISMEDAEPHLFEAIPIEEVSGATDDPMLSNSIVNYVIRTKENVVLNNATKEGNFTKDLYVQKTKPQSILCTPLLNQGKLAGILYLENNLAKGAFTQDRLRILGLLSSQMAISIENAIFYESLEEKVNERTQEVMLQKTIIEKKNHDITSSINYAKRIQEAMLPEMQEISEAFEDSFIFFRPRDIVSGDFYWFAELPNKLIIAAVDCTGHGVPGAFMSLIGNEILFEITESRHITEANIILEELSKGVTKALKQNSTENKDGMDLALCVIDKEKGKVDFAGAKNPLFYIQDNTLLEMAGDKFPIGGTWGKSERKFTKKEITVDKDTYFYIFTDGYEDQFGGTENRKFMKKKMRELFLKIHKLPMNEQHEIIQQTMNNWVGNTYKQLDDMLIIGFKLSPKVQNKNQSFDNYADYA